MTVVDIEEIMVISATILIIGIAEVVVPVLDLVLLGILALVEALVVAVVVLVEIDKNEGHSLRICQIHKLVSSNSKYIFI